MMSPFPKWRPAVPLLATDMNGIADSGATTLTDAQAKNLKKQGFAALGTVRFGTPRTEFYSNVSTSNGGAARPLGTTRAGQAADDT